MTAIDLINALRAEQGVGGLFESPYLVAAASSHSQYMSRFGLTHNEYLIVSPFARMKKAGYSPLSGGGECIAFGQQTVDEVVQAWMNSPGHRAILMGPYTHAGIARAGVYWTADLASGMSVVPDPAPPAPNKPDLTNWRPF